MNLRGRGLGAANEESLHPNSTLPATTPPPPQPPPAGEQSACSPGFYFRPTGVKYVFFATVRMFHQTELLIWQDEGRNVQPVVVTVGFRAPPPPSPLSLSHKYFWLANLDDGWVSSLPLPPLHRLHFWKCGKFQRLGALAKLSNFPAPP